MISASGVRTVYAGDLILLKTEVVNHKTGQTAVVPEDRRVVIPNAHEPIISREIFSSRQRKSGQNIAVLPGWEEKTYLGGCCSATAVAIR